MEEGRGTAMIGSDVIRGYCDTILLSLLAEGAATVLFAAAAVVFILVGGGLLFFTLRAGLQNWKKGGPDSSPDDDKE